jgi:signal transduction histidine kinase
VVSLVISLLVLAFLAFNAFVVYPAFESILVRGVEEDAENIARHLLPELFPTTGRVGRPFLGPNLDQAELKAIERMELDFRVYKLKVYDETGTVLYSTDADEIGQVNTDEYFRDEVTRGRRISELREQGERSMEGRVVTRDVVETYIPHLYGARFLGALEIYYDVTERKEAMGRIARYSLVGMGCLALGLVGVVLVLLARESSHVTLLKQNQELREDVDRILQHDLKAPLTNMLSGVTYLESEGCHEDGPEVLEQMRLSGRRMLNMINSSLDLYRMETGRYQYEPQAVELVSLCRQVLCEQEAQAREAGVELLLRFEGEEPEDRVLPVPAEDMLMRMLLGNLMKNALEATPEGGWVRIDLRREEQGVALAVSNPGDIPPEVRERIFEKYYTSGKKGGTGLGTYSARLMARAQGGELSLECGGGVVEFTVHLPRLESIFPA